jgi:cell division septal protein FtsQ
MRLTRVRAIGMSVGFVLFVAISLYAFYLIDQFLVRDARFAFTPASSKSQAVKSNDALRVSGVSHASQRAIEAVFSEDVGRSLYSIPLEDRLASLRTVAWVRQAAIARVWPNRLVVSVSERIPVAFVTLPPARFGLIDADGVILPPAKDKFTLPVLTGLKPGQDLAERRDAVQRMLHLTGELHDSVKDISEIDVAKPDNIIVSRLYGGRMRKLMLGDGDYKQRYENFVNHFSEIDAKVPGAKVIDLRLEDRITVVEATQ